ncbi:NAD-dependent epimerase/dehydratase family protein [Jannaschia seohaensis]|nr:NAD-dependent epimerase/dehydratase family protein [Jannaschia seohaensis]
MRPFLPGAVWLSRTDPLSGVAGARALVALAGVTRGDAAALRANTDVALAALEAARAHRVPRVFLLSSAAVYGRAPSPLSAEAAPSPAAPYGTAKAEMERAVAKWRAAHPDGPEAVCLRLGNVAGADALFGNLTPGAVPAIHVWPDGTTPRRSYIGPRSLARVLERLASAPALPSILNLAAPGPVAMGDLASAAGHAWTPVPAPPEALAEVHLDTAPLEALVPLAPATPDALVAEWREATA